MKTNIKRAALAVIVFLVFIQVSKANISLPEIFSDNMVL
jgi:hypothetical protein